MAPIKILKRNERLNGQERKDNQPDKPKQAVAEVKPEVPAVVKHPLNHAWTLWYFEPERNKSWENNQHQVNTFDTVEDFWGLFTHIISPSELKIGTDYSLFKKGIMPMWEDKANKNGGRWIIALSKNQMLELDRYWIDALMCIIGEAHDSFADICGIVVNIRQKGEKIAIWTSNSKNRANVMEIGKHLKEGLNIPHIKLQYETHTDSMTKNSSAVKMLYEI